MDIDRVKIATILAGVAFITIWGIIVSPILYPWIDAQSWMPPPVALLANIAMYGFAGFIFSFALVGFAPDLTLNALYMGFLEALGFLALDGTEPPLTVEPSGRLVTWAIGWRSDILTTWHYIWKTLGVPQSPLLFQLVILGLALTWIFVVLFASREVARDWLEALT